MKICKTYHPEMQSEQNRHLNCLNWWKTKVSWMFMFHAMLDAMSISYSNLGRWEEYLERYAAWFSCSAWPTRHKMSATAWMIYGSISVLWCLPPSTQKSSSNRFRRVQELWLGHPCFDPLPYAKAVYTKGGWDGCLQAWPVCQWQMTTTYWFRTKWWVNSRAARSWEPSNHLPFSVKAVFN